MGRHERELGQDVGRIATALEGAGSSRARDTSKARSTKLPLLAMIPLWLGGSTSASEKARRRRRAFPITGYVGPNGGGKSLAMVHDTIPSLRAGRLVLSTVALLDMATGLPHPAYVPLTNFDQLLLAKNCDVLMDEVTGIANSRDSSKLPPAVQNLLVQLRRRDVVLRWTAPNWSRADKIIREVTQGVVECRGYFPGAPLPAEGESGVRLWAPNRLFSFSLYDTIDFDDWTTGKRDKLPPLTRQWFKGVGSDAFASYDTMDSVALVTHSDADNQCTGCGHKKRVQYCACDKVNEPRLRPLLDLAPAVSEVEGLFDLGAAPAVFAARTSVLIDNTEEPPA